jgi:hypothetical protein
VIPPAWKFPASGCCDSASMGFLALGCCDSTSLEVSDPVLKFILVIIKSEPSLEFEAATEQLYKFSCIPYNLCLNLSRYLPAHPAERGGGESYCTTATGVYCQILLSSAYCAVSWPIGPVSISQLLVSGIFV